MQSEPLSTVVNKGLPQRRALSPSAPVILLTMRTGAVSSVSSYSSIGSANPVLTLLSTIVYGLASGRVLMSLIVAGLEPGDIELDARLRHKARQVRSAG